MIARIAGQIEDVTDSTVLIDLGSGLWYEVLVPAVDAQRLAHWPDRDVVLYTIHYVEGDPARGAQTPRLVGFLSQKDREFFRLLTKVKGLGVRKALRALAKDVGDIAAAIVRGDAEFLTDLPEIGKKTAETIIAELRKKVADFAAGGAAVAAAGAAEVGSLSEPAAQAVAILVQLGEKRADALAMVQRAVAAGGEQEAPEAIIQQVYRQRGLR
jgi:holliday junction DNA helicase RuvA